MKIGLVYEGAFLNHRPDGYHPERPERLTSCLEGLEETGLLGDLVEVSAEPADRDLLESVHEPEYLDLLNRRLGPASGHGDASGYLDPDTYYSSGSLQAALLAAGGAARLVSKVLSGELDSALALVRPPGHHATSDRAMGFCLLNNAAVAASAALLSGAARVAVLDWDVHHGNGTQDIFYGNDRVLYCSLHQYPHYPGTGRTADVGADAGLGATVNCPMPAGAGSSEYGEAFRRVILPALTDFDPDLVIVSSGFDSHRADPLGGIRLDESDFRNMGLALRHNRARAGKDRVVVLLEGGYNLDVLGGCTSAVVEALAADEPTAPQAWLDAPAQPSVRDMIQNLSHHLHSAGHRLPDSK